jgi:hypothetical protein
VLLTEQLLLYGHRSRFGPLQHKKRVLLVGTAEDSARTRAELKQAGEASVEVVGEVDINESSVAQLVRLLHERSPNGVIINTKHTFFGQIEKAIQACEIEGVEAWLVADFFQTQVSRTTFDEFYGRPVLVFRSVPDASWQGVFKLVLDFTGALFLLALLGVPMAVVALFIRRTSPGPVLFRQQRCGLNGQPFTMLKFRTMVSDAEQRKHEIESLNEMGGPVFKVTNDPRVTPSGAGCANTASMNCPSSSTSCAER